VTVLDAGNLSRVGYSLLTWNTRSDDTGSSHAPGSTFAMGASDMTLYAVWGVKFTLTCSANGGGGAVPVDSTLHVPGSPVTLLSGTGLTPPSSKLAFAGWNSLPNGSGTTYADASTLASGFSSNTTLYALWPQAVISIYDANGGSGTAPVDPNSYAPRASVTIKT
jgi:hypothetical protein